MAADADDVRALCETFRSLTESKPTLQVCTPVELLALCAVVAVAVGAVIAVVVVVAVIAAVVVGSVDLPEKRRFTEGETKQKVSCV